MAEEFCTILGVRFFCGSAKDAVERIRRGGLLVVPAAPALKDIASNRGYREALLGADLCIPDSAFMVLIWNRIAKQKIRRVSGLAYLRELLAAPDVQRAGNVVWIMANPASAKRNRDWLKGEGIEIPEECVHLAPIYAPIHAPIYADAEAEIEDAALLELLERIRPQHVILTIGGGTQERLGYYLKQRLSYPAAIHCVGAAIAFLSGDQVPIPVWADRMYLGWLLRSVAQPRRFVPRYWGARKLYRLMVRYRDRLPEIRG